MVLQTTTSVTRWRTRLRTFAAAEVRQGCQKSLGIRGPTALLVSAIMVDQALLRSPRPPWSSETGRMRTRRPRPTLVPRSDFAGFPFPPDVIVVAVRWYLRFDLSYRDVEELLAERGVEVDHVSVYRWVQRFTPLLAEAARPCRHRAGDRWFVDETYVALRLPRDRPVRAGHRRVHRHSARCHGCPAVL